MLSLTKVNIQNWGGGGGGVTLCHTEGTSADVRSCKWSNYRALKEIYGMSILLIRAFSPRALEGLYVVYLKNYLTKGGEGGRGTPGSSPGYAPV